MTHAYDELYLEGARRALGGMLEFAVYDMGYDIEKFFGMFIGSGMARGFGVGDCSVVAGLSGVELCYEVLRLSGVKHELVKPEFRYDPTPEYWTGWALAYYQWESGLSFAAIVRAVPVKEILALWSPYHEMDIRQFCDRMLELSSD